MSTTTPPSPAAQDAAPPSPASASGSWAELLRSPYGWVVLALTGGVAMHAINVHIVTTVLPSVVQEIGGLSWYAWNTTLFVVASIVGAALSVRALALVGPRVAMVAALAVFGVGALLCASATNMPAMLLGRAVQGLGGGTVGALSYALIRLVLPPHLWSRAIALVSAMWGVATLSGPAVGGLFAQSGHWRWAFWCLLPLLLAQAALVARQLRPSQILQAPNVSAGGIATAQIALLAGSALLIAGASVVPAGVWAWLCVLGGAAAGAAAVAVERRATHRLLPSQGTYLAQPLGLLYTVIALLLMGTMTEIFVPYFLQHLHALRPLTAGYITALMAGGWSVASVLFSGRSGAAARRLMLIGPLLSAVGLATLAVAMGVDSPAALWVSGVALVAIGMGVGMAWPHVLAAVMHSAPKDEADAAAAAITTVQLYGMAVGAALVGLVANALGLSAQPDAAGLARAALWLFGLFAVFPLLGALRIRRLLAHPQGVPATA